MNIRIPAFKNTLYVRSTHYVEILWNGDLPSHEPKSPDGYRDRIINRGDFDEGHTGLGNDECLSLGSLIDQL